MTDILMAYVNMKSKAGCVDKQIQFSTFYCKMESSCHLGKKQQQQQRF